MTMANSQGRSLAEQLIHDLGVCLLMPSLVPCNGCTDLAKLLVSMQAGVSGSVSMGDLCGALLERRVDEAEVGVIVSLGVHA